MRIESVHVNNHRRAFTIVTPKGEMDYPFVRATPEPTSTNPVAFVTVDPELGGEGFTYSLTSGAEGSVHMEQVLEYNRDPGYMRDLLVYQLTLEAGRRLGEGRLTKREVIRRLGTSPTQLYRLLDPTNTRKSVDAMLSLLQVLDCDVELTVRPAGRAAPPARRSV